MNWLKGLGISVKVAVLAFLAALAVMAAKRQKANAEKWHDKAVDIELGKVDAGTMTAKAASTQAKLHENRAKAIKDKAIARAKERGGKDERIDEDISDILDQFRNS
jgi:hypothetical protein